MKLKQGLAAASVGVGVLGVAGLPVGAAGTIGPFYNNGCEYWASNSTAINGQTWGGTGCDYGWVEVVWRDSKGETKRQEHRTAWNRDGYYATYLNVSNNGNTLLFTCHAARSRDAGNWSIERFNSGASGSGSCSQAP